MFTGLVSEVGEVVSITKNNTSAILKIKAPTTASGLKIGDSVSVNGVCLTATEVADQTFTTDVMIQTLSITSLSALNNGTPVNLELAALVGSRLGGHIVQGHVDGVGNVVALKDGEKWAEFIVQVPEKLMKYIVAQGSICLDGVSLTIGSINDDQNQITLWLIPETLAKTILSNKKTGDSINIEVDVLAKYIERIMKRSE